MAIIIGVILWIIIIVCAKTVYLEYVASPMWATIVRALLLVGILAIAIPIQNFIWQLKEEKQQREREERMRRLKEAEENKRIDALYQRTKTPRDLQDEIDRL